MTEIAPQGNLSPSSDLDELRQRYIPAKACVHCRHHAGCDKAPNLCAGFRWGMSRDAFAQAGVELVEQARHCFLVLGELAEWGWAHLNVGSMTKNEFALFCAQSWGCTRTTVLKAWTVATVAADLPPDVPPTLVYEIASGVNDPEELEEILDRALFEGWSAWEVREIKALRRAGVLDEWVLPSFFEQENYLLVAINGKQTICAELTADKDEPNAHAGIHLLKMRAKVKER